MRGLSVHVLHCKLHRNYRATLKQNKTDFSPEESIIAYEPLSRVLLSLAHINAQCSDWLQGKSAGSGPPGRKEKREGGAGKAGGELIRPAHAQACGGQARQICRRVGVVGGAPREAGAFK